MSKVRALRIGEEVLVPFGAAKLRAVVIEDRGAIGVGGRQLVRVESDDEAHLSFEVPAELLLPRTGSRRIGSTSGRSRRR